MLRVSSPIDRGGNYPLLNRSPTPYRPPHLCKSTESKDLANGKRLCSSKCQSAERGEEKKRQTEEHKENLDTDTHCEGSGDDKKICKKCHQLKEDTPSGVPNNDCYCPSYEVSQCKGKLSPPFSNRSMEKRLGTKFANVSPVQEHYNVNVNETKNTMLFSSVLVDQFTEREKNPSGGISMGDESKISEVHSKPNRSEDENESTNVACHGSGYPKELVELTALSEKEKLSEQFCSSNPSSVHLAGRHLPKETEQFSSLDAIENHFSRHQGVECCDIENSQPNTASYSSQNLIHLLKSDNGATDVELALLKQNSSNARTAGIFQVSESNFFQNQSLENSNMESTETGTATRTTEILGINQNLEPIQETVSSKKLQFNPSAGSSEYDFLWDIDFPSPFNSLIDELIRFDHESATMSLNCSQLADLHKNNESDLVCREVDNRVKLRGAVGEFDEKATAIEEIRLPDEDNLITLDDLVFQMDSVLMADGTPIDADLVFSRTPATFNASFGNDKSPSGQGNVTLASSGMVNSKSSSVTMGTNPPYPCLFTYPQKNMYLYGPVCQSVMNSFPEQMIVPGGFPQQLVYYPPWPSQTQNPNHNY